LGLVIHAVCHSLVCYRLQDAGRSRLYGINSRIITPFVYAWQIPWIVLTSGSPDTKKGRKF